MESSRFCFFKKIFNHHKKIKYEDILVRKNFSKQVLTKKINI